MASTIPIVCAPISDPVSLGLVDGVNRPGRNVTGIATLTKELNPKRLEFLYKLLPTPGLLGVMHNPACPNTNAQVLSIPRSAASVGCSLVLARATTSEQIEAAFAQFAELSRRVSSWRPTRSSSATASGSSS